MRTNDDIGIENWEEHLRITGKKKRERMRNKRENRRGGRKNKKGKESEKEGEVEEIKE